MVQPATVGDPETSRDPSQGHQVSGVDELEKAIDPDLGRTNARGRAKLRELGPGMQRELE